MNNSNQLNYNIKNLQKNQKKLFNFFKKLINLNMKNNKMQDNLNQIKI